MSTEETNGFSAPNEDANVAGADSVESAPADQAAENNDAAPGAGDAAQASSEASADDMSAFEDQIEDSDLAKALERIAAVEDQLARANAELYNQGQEYANYVRRSKEAIPGHKTAGQDEVIESLISADVDHPVIGQVLTSGYRRGERVVRAAKVLVNNPE